MKLCPQCHQMYADETLNFCLSDGTGLVRSPDPSAKTFVSSSHESYEQTIAMQSPITSESLQPARQGVSPLFAYLAIGLVALIAILVGASAPWWWKYATAQPPDAAATSPAVKIAGELREEFRLARENLEKTGVADFARAEAKLEALRNLDNDNGRVWYFAGEIKRVKDTGHFTIKSCAKAPMNPNFNLETYEQDFYRYLELARRGSPDDNDMGDKACYENQNGICAQRTAWIQHLLANDLYQAAIAATNLHDRVARLERAAEYAKEARRYRRTDGGEGFEQCIDTLALERSIKDAMNSPSSQ